MNPSPTAVSPSRASGPAVAWRELVFDGWRTGALDIGLTDRRILSLPTQLGCQVGCTFCVSSGSQQTRNLKAAQMLALLDLCLDSQPADSRPLELSFTGEGESVLNETAAHSPA